LSRPSIITEENFEGINDVKGIRESYPEIPRPRTAEEMRI